MAGHNKWSQIKRKKAANDNQRGKVISKHIRAIQSAVREGGGDDPSTNLALKNALSAAKTDDVPAENVDRAIERAVGGSDGGEFESVVYEGYGPSGVAFLVEALTDNRNRTASEVRAAFSKHGGSMGETNSVAFQFERVGQIVYPAETAAYEEIFEAAAEAGAQDVQSDEESHTIICAPDDFSDVRDHLTEKYGDAREARLAWRPMNTTPIDEDQASTLFKLIEVLEDNDDVREVSTNFEVSDEVLARLTA